MKVFFFGVNSPPQKKATSDRKIKVPRRIDWCGPQQVVVIVVVTSKSGVLVLVVVVSVIMKVVPVSIWKNPNRSK